MPGTQLAKAVIIDIDHGSIPIECLFNPKEFSLSKTNQWSAQANKGQDVPVMEFGGGNPASLTLELFFDTFGGPQGSRDVSKLYTQPLWNLTLIDPRLTDATTSKGRPPRVRFQWGTIASFTAAITNLSLNYTLFLEDGTPVRATASVTFQQLESETYFPAQNPTSGGQSAERQWTVRAGDSLSDIAYAVYGDASRWRQIADSNRLTRVRRLPPGLVLEIPNSA